MNVRPEQARRRPITGVKVTLILAVLLVLAGAWGVWIFVKDQREQVNEFEEENWPHLYNEWHVRMYGETPSADDCQVAEVREFQTVLNELLMRASAARNDFEILMTQGRSNPSIMDQAWSDEVSRVSKEMSALDDEMEKMDVPLLMRPMHENLVLSGLNITAAWFAVRIWVESDRSDQIYLEQAGGLNSNDYALKAEEDWKVYLGWCGHVYS